MTSTAPSSPAASNAGRPWRILSGAVLGLLLCGAVQARQSDRSQKIDVQGVHLDSSYQPNGVTRIEHAVITQGTLKASGDLATIYLDGQMAVKRVVFTGHAHIQQEDDQGNLMSAQADAIDYDMPSGIATLTGQVQMHNAALGSFSGEKLVYNTSTGHMTAQGTSDKRVHLVFKARQQPAAASSAAKTPGKGN